MPADDQNLGAGHRVVVARRHDLDLAEPRERHACNGRDLGGGDDPHRRGEVGPLKRSPARMLGSQLARLESLGELRHPHVPPAIGIEQQPVRLHPRDDHRRRRLGSGGIE